MFGKRGGLGRLFFFNFKLIEMVLHVANGDKY
jgi:hypothetical protein